MPSCRGVLCLAAITIGACNRVGQGVRIHLDDRYPENLSEWRIFSGRLRDLVPNTRVVPYDVVTPLFSNRASKFRTIWMPEGTTGTYDRDGVFELPIGTILTKTFTFPNRHLETRLFVHQKNGWQGIVYVWRPDQSDAALNATPSSIAVSASGTTIDYDIPNVNQCKVCHEGPNDNGPLGITARQLNREYAYSTGATNQLVYWTDNGYLTGTPSPGQALKPASDLEGRARAYLDANCAACHIVGGRGTKSGVFLTHNETNPRNLGVCKPATEVSASFDIVPGRPDSSLLLHRMLSTDRKIMMPDIGHTVVDEEGVALIREWIGAMNGDCPPSPLR